MDAGAVVVSVADHRRSGGPADRGLDLQLDRREIALDDLDQDRVDHRHVSSREGLGTTGSRRRAHEGCLSMTRFPKESTTARNPGWSGTVEENSSSTAGPSITSRCP